MYRVVVKTRGKDRVTALGTRYCLTKRSAIKLAVSFSHNGCEIDVEKFVRLYGDIFAWSEEELWDEISNDEECYGTSRRFILR